MDPPGSLIRGATGPRDGRGVGTLAYLPYCVFNYASPALSLLYGFTGFKIEKLDEESG